MSSKKKEKIEGILWSGILKQFRLGTDPRISLNKMGRALREIKDSPATSDPKPQAWYIENGFQEPTERQIRSWVKMCRRTMTEFFAKAIEEEAKMVKKGEAAPAEDYPSSDILTAISVNEPPEDPYKFGTTEKRTKRKKPT